PADSRAVRAGARRIRIDLRRRARRDAAAADRGACCNLGRSAHAADPAGELPVAAIRLCGSDGAQPITSTRSDARADARTIALPGRAICRPDVDPGGAGTRVAAQSDDAVVARGERARK